jgi:large subunit ribosomal protein L43
MVLWRVFLVTWLSSLTSCAVNGRDKVIPLQEFEVNGVERKVQLLLDSSGAKIKPLKKGRIVESTAEAARGIWSGLHVDTPFKI